MAALLNNQLIFTKQSQSIFWNGLNGSSKSLAIANLAKSNDKFILVVTSSMLEAEQIISELKFFANEENISDKIMLFPGLEILPYDNLSPHSDIISERLSTLNKLIKLQQGILVVPVQTLMHFVAPKSYIMKNSLVFHVGEKLEMQFFCKLLIESGYRRVEQVLEHGEFSNRGSIIDIYPMNSENPYRIDLFDDEIDSIRTFDVDTQLSIEKIEKINVLPANEVLLTQPGIEEFKKRWGELFSEHSIICPIYKSIMAGKKISGIEYYLSMFFSERETLFDYIPDDSIVVHVGLLNGFAEAFWLEIKNRYELLSHDLSRPILPPEQIVFTTEKLFSTIKKFNQIKIQPEKKNQDGIAIDFETKNIPQIIINHHDKNPLADFQKFISDVDFKILFCVGSAGRKDRLQELIKSINILPQSIEKYKQFLSNSEIFQIVVCDIAKGFIAENLGFAIITENDLLGERVRSPSRKKKEVVNDFFIHHLAELNIGDPVVHIEHGVGRFIGLETISAGDITDEYLAIEYANKAKLYVPISSLNLISHFSGTKTDFAPLHSLGTSQWEKEKRKAKEKIRDVAIELLEIYAKRESKNREPFNINHQEYLAFSDAFPFDETPDQLKAIESVLDDLQKTRPMDRLVCGDVGFGKTEVAIRAVFIALQNNKQVVMLVPTTLLAQQHFENFRDRFAGFPIVIESLSRFKNKKEQKDIIDRLQLGKIDVVIGTHKLLSEDVKFNKLGLLIIDEEHRFGVRQKEKIKYLRAEVDILTLTATPIPRTLNMAFHGIRDLSIIATPPAKRLKIKTFVYEKNYEIIKEAISREIFRGGQVFYIHNRVDTIHTVAQDLRELVPGVSVGIAHGQMRERELEQVMANFYHRYYNVLVCTTIIETGIDVPTANTIIIDRADMFGMAQLHQLRGRVGRSHHQAYAYLLIPSKKSITKDALKRLEAIESLEDLGVGFALASHDLEIRGAGELLGEEQSGHIEQIGFTLYMDLLEKSVDALKSGKMPDMSDQADRGMEINLQITCLIPREYIPDIHMRLLFYKRIANAKNIDDLNDLRIEMIDRFGLIPTQLDNLFKLSMVKLLLQPFGVIKIIGNKEYITVNFSDNANVDSSKIIRLIQTEHRKYILKGQSSLRINLNNDSYQARFDALENFVKKIK